MALRAVGGVWSAFGVWWAGAEGGMVVSFNKGFFWLLAFRRMTTTDRNDLVPAQEKLEWVKPKISLMDAGDTDGRNR